MDVGSIAAGMAQGKPPTKEQATSLLKTIPGMSDVIETKETIKGMVDRTTGPDDGKPKTCWLKSHGRGFGRPPSGLLKGSPSCNAGKEMSGGLCYDVCP